MSYRKHRESNKMSEDLSRVYGGFASLAGGVDGGSDPSLIEPDQCSLAGNFTFRGQFITVRPPFSNLILDFPDSGTTTNWNGLFQGACFYSSNEFGESGFVVSISGRLFYVTLATKNNVKDITPRVGEVTIANFLVPNAGGSVVVNVNLNGAKVGDTIFIQGGQYTITGIVSNALTVTYVGGATATVPSGTTVYNYGFQPTSAVTTAPFNPPAIGGTVAAVGVSTVVPLSTQTLYILGDKYEMQKDGIGNGTINLKLIARNQISVTVPIGAPVLDTTTPQSTTITTAFTVPGAIGGGAFNIVVAAFGTITNGDLLTIYGGTYTVQSTPVSNTVSVKYTAYPTICPINVSLIDYILHVKASLTASPLTIPAVNGLVNVAVTNTSAIGVYQVVINGGVYIITAIGVSTVDLLFYGVTVTAGARILDVSHNQIYVTSLNPADIDFVDIFQAENYAIVLAGQDSPIIFNGSTSSLAGIGMIPPGVMGTYAWGRIWIVLNDRKSFVASDLNGDPSGTPQNLFVDAILQMTENNLLAGGGAFKIPNNIGLITAITTFPMLDTSLGIGPIMVGCTNGIVSCQAPVDRTTWQNLTYPIDTISALDYGPLGPRSMTAVNGNLWYRAIDGIRSFKMARQDFIADLNVAQSQEVSNILNLDSEGLLFNSSSVNFDNKLFQTVSPYRTPNGLAHRGQVVINYDEVANLRQKSPPSWEGVLTGLNILQIVKGVINGVERAFMFVANNGIEIWEINTDGKYDKVSTTNTVAYTPIQSYTETRRYNFDSAEKLKALYTAELYLDEISDTVSLTIKYRADESPIWQTWATLNFCATEKQCTLQPKVDGICPVFMENSAQYAVRLMLPDPPEVEDCVHNGYTKNGYEFQFRFEGTGHFRIRKFKAHAKIKSQEMEGSCPMQPTCTAVPVCALPLWNYNSHG